MSKRLNMLVSKLELYALGIVVACVAIGAQVGAQTQRTGDNNARAMQQLQQLTGERTQLKAENDKLKQQVEQLTKELAAATSGQAALQQRVKAAEMNSSRDATANQQTTDQIEKQRTQLQELVTRFRETAGALKDSETDRAQIREQLQNRGRELDVCIERNIELYALTGEVLDRLEKKGVWNSLTEKEAFTRIQRTRLENLVDAYRDRAADFRVKENP